MGFHLRVLVLFVANTEVFSFLLKVKMTSSLFMRKTLMDETQQSVPDVLLFLFPVNLIFLFKIHFVM